MRAGPELALVPNGEDPDDVVLLHVVVQRDVTRLSPRDDELAQLMLGRTADQRVPGEYLDRVENAVDGAGDDVRAFFAEEPRHPLEIAESPPRIRYFRQALALGRAAFFPAARART
jgi:hypothetical protein